jgi:hypothetical protein
MNDVKKICLTCKSFRLDTVDSGICRVDKSFGTDYPPKGTNDVCGKWQNCGQQYFIRLGWIKAKTTQASEDIQ